MAESNKEEKYGNSFDALPDEVILKIFGNLDREADRSNVAKVSPRFNRLSKDKDVRREIYITLEEIKKNSGDESARTMFVEQLMNDIKNSKRLKIVIFDRRPADNDNATPSDYYKACTETNDIINMINVEIRGKGYFRFAHTHECIHFSHVLTFFNVNTVGIYDSLAFCSTNWLLRWSADAWLKEGCQNLACLGLKGNVGNDGNHSTKEE